MKVRIKAKGRSGGKTPKVRGKAGGKKSGGRTARAYGAHGSRVGLIRLSQVVKAGGEDEKHRPRLAVMRADVQRCKVEVQQNGTVTFYEGPWIRRRASSSKRFIIRDGVKPFALGDQGWRTVDASAMVPSIPPRFRPPHDLSNYHILWEAEWSPEPPKDPALLKRLGGDLFAVLAVGDLTEVERAVLAGTRRS